jgi:serine/threonine protein kinase
MLIGQNVGHYRLVEELGQGSFGRTWRGVHSRLPNIEAAVKIARPELALNAGFRAALMQQADVLRRLGHPNIAGLQDLVVDGDTVAVLEEMLHGQPLAEIMRNGPLFVDDAQSVLEALLEAVRAAHDLGIVHGDIRPENVFICNGGRVKLADFGIRRVIEAASREGDDAGDHAEGAQAPSAASDLAAIGLVAWLMLAGWQACPKDAFEDALSWFCEGGAPDLPTLRPDCPEWLAAFVTALAALPSSPDPATASAMLVTFRALRGPSDAPKSAGFYASAQSTEGDAAEILADAPTVDESDEEVTASAWAPPVAEEPPPSPAEALPTRVATEEAPAEVATKADAEKLVPAAVAKEPSPRRRAFRWMAGLAVLLLVFAVLAMLWIRHSRTTEPLVEAPTPVAQVAVSPGKLVPPAGGVAEPVVVPASVPAPVNGAAAAASTEPSPAPVASGGAPSGTAGDVASSGSSRRSSSTGAKTASGDASAVGTGFISFDSSPSGADVYVDGTAAGQTPLHRLSARAGPHVLSVRKPGFQTQEYKVDIVAGREMSWAPVVLVR